MAIENCHPIQDDDFSVHPRSHPTADASWVVEANNGEIAGTVAMVDEEGVAGRLLQLRIAPAWNAEPRIPKLLLRAAAECARHSGMLKFAIEAPGWDVDTGGDESSIIEYMRELGFEYARTQQRAGRPILEFYLNLYEGPKIAEHRSESL